MGYFKKQELKRLPLPSNPDFWVDIRTRYAYGEMKKFASTNKDGEVNFELAADIFLVAAIDSWNLTDENDQPVPVDAKNINRLEMSDATYIIEEAGGFLATKTPEKKTNSVRPSLPTSEAAAPAPAETSQ